MWTGHYSSFEKRWRGSRQKKTDVRAQELLQNPRVPNLSSIRPSLRPSLRPGPSSIRRLLEAQVQNLEDQLERCQRESSNPGNAGPGVNGTELGTELAEANTKLVSLRDSLRRTEFARDRYDAERDRQANVIGKLGNRIAEQGDTLKKLGSKPAFDTLELATDELVDSDGAKKTLEDVHADKGVPLADDQISFRVTHLRRRLVESYGFIFEIKNATPEQSDLLESISRDPKIFQDKLRKNTNSTVSVVAAIVTESSESSKPGLFNLASLKSPTSIALLSIIGVLFLVSCCACCCCCKKSNLPEQYRPRPSHDMEAPRIRRSAFYRPPVRPRVARPVPRPEAVRPVPAPENDIPEPVVAKKPRISTPAPLKVVETESSWDERPWFSKVEKNDKLLKDGRSKVEKMFLSKTSKKGINPRAANIALNVFNDIIFGNACCR